MIKNTKKVLLSVFLCGALILSGCAEQTDIPSEGAGKAEERTISEETGTRQ